MLISKNPVKTSIFCDNGIIKMVYYNTVVCELNPHNQKLILDTGLFFTNTTKRRMNQFLQQNKIPLYIFQKNGNWYIKQKFGMISFYKSKMFLEYDEKSETWVTSDIDR